MPPTKKGKVSRLFSDAPGEPVSQPQARAMPPIPGPTRWGQDGPAGLSEDGLKFAAKVEEFSKWFGSLDDLGRMNFRMLVTLPNAVDIIARCPDPVYRDMATFGLAIALQAGGGVQDNTGPMEEEE